MASRRGTRSRHNSQSPEPLEGQAERDVVQTLGLLSSTRESQQMAHQVALEQQQQQQLHQLQQHHELRSKQSSPMSHKRGLSPHNVNSEGSDFDELDDELDPHSKGRMPTPFDARRKQSRAAYEQRRKKRASIFLTTELHSKFEALRKGRPGLETKEKFVSYLLSLVPDAPPGQPLPIPVDRQFVVPEMPKPENNSLKFILTPNAGPYYSKKQAVDVPHSRQTSATLSTSESISPFVSISNMDNIGNNNTSFGPTHGDSYPALMRSGNNSIMSPAGARLVGESPFSLSPNSQFQLPGRATAPVQRVMKPAVQNHFRHLSMGNAPMSFPLSVPYQHQPAGSALNLNSASWTAQQQQQHQPWSTSANHNHPPQNMPLPPMHLSEQNSTWHSTNSETHSIFSGLSAFKPTDDNVGRN